MGLRAPLLAIASVLAVVASCNKSSRGGGGAEEPPHHPSEPELPPGPAPQPASSPTATSTAEGSDDGTVDTPPPEAKPIVSGLRRLSAHELANSVADLVPGASASAIVAALPEEKLAPFDNEYKDQLASQVYIDALDQAIASAVQTALANPTTRDQLVGCTPASKTDVACLKLFITRVGRLTLRRALTQDEVDSFATAISFGTSGNDFYAAVEVVARRLLLDPEFLFRRELGVAVDGQPGVYKLTPVELAGRLAFTLWGRTPPSWLLDKAEAGELATPAQIKAASEQLIADPKGQEQLQRLHALWLGYAKMSASGLDGDLVTEARALVTRSLTTGTLRTLLTSGETYLNGTLASHYGLPAPTSGWTWIAFGENDRTGLLTQGAVMQNGASAADTSPVRRGKFISERLLCSTVPPPPPEVDVDAGPKGADPGACKSVRFKVHAQGSCAGCHQMLDAIGFALEGYDDRGKGRTAELLDPTCAIDGKGTIYGEAFTGAKGLVSAMLARTGFDDCAVKQAFRFANGRAPSGDDAGVLYDVAHAYPAETRRMDQLMLALVTHPMFQLRKEEPDGP